jgi:hypothetical protein
MCKVMGTALIFKKVLEFLKKNWLIFAVILGVWVVSGAAKRLFGRIGMWFSLSSAIKNADNPAVIDFNFMAMSVHNAMYTGLFGWSEDEDALIGFVNGLASMEQFLELCRAYALKYDEDLRTQLRDHLNDNQYSKLLWK